MGTLNVGTLQFQAPEFWDKQPPNNRIRYHRNVDVYSTGLTFVAMLQAEPGKKLVPREKNALDTTAIRTPIGLMAFTRMRDGLPVVNIIEDNAHDDDTTKGIKQLIRQMIQPEADKRLSSIKVCSALSKLVCRQICSNFQKGIY